MIHLPIPGFGYDYFDLTMTDIHLQLIHTRQQRRTGKDLRAFGEIGIVHCWMKQPDQTGLPLSA